MDAMKDRSGHREESVAGGGTNRRNFLAGIAGVAGAIALHPTLQPSGGLLAHERSAGTDRAKQAYDLRQDAALAEFHTRTPSHVANGDEQAYSTHIGNYSKGLPHNPLGEVDPSAYKVLVGAMHSGDPSDFEAIPMGSPSGRRHPLVNPQSGLAFDIEGSDSQKLAIPPAPNFSSAEEGAEMTELYWQALLRDVNFTDYDNDSRAQDAAAELSAMRAFTGPRDSTGHVTTRTLFRGFTAGDLVGPYLSQFFLIPPAFGAQMVDTRLKTYVPGVDYMTDYNEWLSIQDGSISGSNTFDSVRRYPRNGRDLSAFVHVDILYQAYFNACLLLIELNCPFNPGNPYNSSENQTGFGTFGAPHIKSLMAEVATRALKSVWYQKWFVHRRLRPEAFGGAVHNVKTGKAGYPVNQNVLNSEAAKNVHNLNGSYLLPMAFPEGCPLHPAYGAGHATVAGACVTILKAFFDCSGSMSDLLAHSSLENKAPVVASWDGATLIPYSGSDGAQMTIEGELNKIAANVGIGRNYAGVHWRSDYTQSMLLGEKVAISILRDQRACYNENFDGFTFQKFDGTSVTV